MVQVPYSNKTFLKKFITTFMHLFTNLISLLINYKSAIKLLLCVTSGSWGSFAAATAVALSFFTHYSNTESV